jgi:hypothetical protein
MQKSLPNEKETQTSNSKNILTIISPRNLTNEQHKVNYTDNFFRDTNTSRHSHPSLRYPNSNSSSSRFTLSSPTTHFVIPDPYLVIPASERADSTWGFAP